MEITIKERNTVIYENSYKITKYKYENNYGRREW